MEAIAFTAKKALRFPPDQNSWWQIAGSDADDPNWDAYGVAIAENRRAADAILEQSRQQIYDARSVNRGHITSPPAHESP